MTTEYKFKPMLSPRLSRPIQNMFDPKMLVQQGRKDPVNPFVGLFIQTANHLANSEKTPAEGTT